MQIPFLLPGCFYGVENIFFDNKFKFAIKTSTAKTV